MKFTINKNQITSYTVNDAQEYTDYNPLFYVRHRTGAPRYLIDIRLFNLKLFRIGKWKTDMIASHISLDDHWTRDAFNKEMIEDDRQTFIKDGILYKKPEVILFMSDEKMLRKYFDSFEDAQKFVENIKSSEENFVEL